MITPATTPVPSPCNQTCIIDAATGYCTGCGRTLGEIGAWASASPAQQRAIVQALPARLEWLARLR